MSKGFHLPQVPVVGANPLLGSMEYGAPPEDNSVLPEIHESTKPALPESAQPSPTFPLRLSAPAGGQPIDQVLDNPNNWDVSKGVRGTSKSRGFGSF